MRSDTPCVEAALAVAGRTPVACEPPAPALSVSRRRALRALPVVACAGLLAACAKAPPGPPPPPPPGKLRLTLRAKANANPSVSGRPSPLVLRLFELKSDTAFGRVDFLTLHQNERGALGADVVKRDELVLAPGEERTIERMFAPETTHFGVMAVFRDLERAQWRVLRPVKPSMQHTWTVQADDRTLSLTGQP